MSRSIEPVTTATAARPTVAAVEAPATTDVGRLPADTAGIAARGEGHEEQGEIHVAGDAPSAECTTSTAPPARRHGGGFEKQSTTSDSSAATMAAPDPGTTQRDAERQGSAPPDGGEAKEGSGKGDKEKQGHWLKQEQQDIPYNSIWMFVGLMLMVFLAALDQTIVSTALPSIAAQLGSSAAFFTWVASAYLLTATSLIPMWGRLSDLVGRKPLLWVAISTFLFGSVMCGAAQNATWLEVCRGVQGLGGGGIIALAQTILGDTVSLEKRGAAAGIFGLVWGLASVIGPLVGGVLAEKASWRWCFFINLPIGGVAAAVLFFTLNLPQRAKKTVREVWQQFDKLGYLLLLSAIVIFLLGFVFAETNGFSSARSIACITVGGLLFPLTVAWEFYVERRWTEVKPVLPPRLFRLRTTMVVLFTVASHGMAFFSATYYLPVYFQATQGSSPILSAVQMLPFSLVSAAMSAVSGLILTRIKAYRPVLWVGFGVYTLGSGLMTMLRADSSVAEQEIFILIAGLGLGCLFQTPLIAITAAMPPSEMAASTSAMALVRSASGAVGISISGAIFNASVRSKTAGIAGYTLPANPSENLRDLVHIQPPQLSREVVAAYADSIRQLWIVWTPFLGVSFLLTLCVKGYSLQRRLNYQAKQQKPQSQQAQQQDDLSEPDKRPHDVEAQADADTSESRSQTPTADNTHGDRGATGGSESNSEAHH